MQAYIPEFILAGLAMLLLLAETFCKKTPKFIFGLIGAAGTLAMLPFYMEGLYDNIYIILALVATAVTLLLSVDFRAVINLSSNDSKSQDGTGEFYILPLLACVGITSLCKASNLVELFVSLEVLTLSSFIMVGYFRRNLGSTEAGIKYLILGAVSTGFLVFGLAGISALREHSFIMKRSSATPWPARQPPPCTWPSPCCCSVQHSKSAQFPCSCGFRMCTRELPLR